MDIGSSRKLNLVDVSDMGSKGARFALGGANAVSEYTVRSSAGEEEPAWNMTTVVDRVYEYIKGRQTISVSEMSEKLGIPMDQLERIVTMLEESNLVKVKYSVVPNGRIDVLLVNEEKKTEVCHKKRTEELKNSFMADMKTFDSTLSSIEQHLKMWSSELEESVLTSDVPEDHLRDMNRESMHIERSLDDIARRTLKRIQHLKKRMSAMRSAINHPIKVKNGNGSGVLSGLKSLF